MALSIDELNTCAPGQFVAALGHLFEHSPWVAEEAAKSRPYPGKDALLEGLCAAMRRAPEERQLQLIRAHPDLAGRLAKAGALTPASAKEQAQAGLDKLALEEAAEIERLNATYKQRFGFPFIICARLNDKNTILAAMRKRVENSLGTERSTALDEIAKIAALRLNDALADPK